MLTDLLGILPGKCPLSVSIKQARQLISPNYGLRVRRDERNIESCHALVACFNFHSINARESKLSWTFSWNFTNGLHSVFLLSPSSDLPASPELLGPIRSGAWGLHARGFPRFWEPFGLPKSLSSHSDPDPARPKQHVFSDAEFTIFQFRRFQCQSRQLWPLSKLAIVKWGFKANGAADVVKGMSKSTPCVTSGESLRRPCQPPSWALAGYWTCFHAKIPWNAIRAWELPCMFEVYLYPLYPGITRNLPLAPVCGPSLSSG